MSKSKKKAESVADKVLNLGTWLQSKTLKEIQMRIKDKSGYLIKTKDLSTNLLYLVRRKKVDRDKNEDRDYIYSIVSGVRDESE